jgi:predicted acetyltransferase
MVSVAGMFQIRTITADDAEVFRSRVSRGFGTDAETDDAAQQRFDAIFELDRTLAAFDGEEMIGTGGGFSLRVTVPGGEEVAMGGTTVITVQPTHRRRGVLRSLMDHHLDDVAERGEPLAGLWASESSIYGRFGYGPATWRHVAKLDASAIAIRAEAVAGAIRLLEKDDADPVLRSLYESARSGRAGMLTRSDAWWTHRLLADPESWREGKSKLRYAVVEESGSATGYAIYRQKSNWDDFLADGVIDVSEVITTTQEAHSALWGFLTNIDLFPKVEWWNMPIDDPLLWKVTDARRITRRVVDALWVRVMDVPAALSARTYDHDGVLTFELNDPTRPDTSGTYRLEVTDGTGTCLRVDTSPEVRLEADLLGALYLGGGDASAMAASGRVEGDRASLKTLHRLFRSDQPPWCNEVF